MNFTGMRRDSPACNVCSVKQKHSVLLKYSDAVFGAMLGTALPTIAFGATFVASNQASLSSPGCTRTLPSSGANCHFSALFTVATPLLLIMIILVVGGFFRSLQFTAINTVAYAEVEPAQMSRATTLVSVNQQLAISAGVAVGAFSVEATMMVRHVSELSAAEFPPAFIVVAIISAASTYFFWQMPDDAGHEISGRKAVEISSRKGAAKAAAKAASETTEDARDQRL